MGCTGWHPGVFGVMRHRVDWQAPALNAKWDRVAATMSFSQMLIGFTWSECAVKRGKGDLELGAKNKERAMQAGALDTKAPTFTLWCGFKR